jgi:hypothetical protein
MPLGSRSIRRLFLGAQLAALAALAVAGPGPAGARLAPTAHPAPAPPAQECLGRPATIIGHGMIHGTAHADVIIASAGVDHVIGTLANG